MLKNICILTLPFLYGASLLVSAFDQTPFGLDTTRNASCPDVLSCKMRNVDTCCSPKYGLLVLAQQWIVGYGPKDAFTLHGLWPDTCDGGHGPENGCDSSRLYDDIGTIVKADYELYNDMNAYWPSYKGNNPSFWSHEWNKHGTCVSTMDPKCYNNYTKHADVRDFFRTALDLRKKFDIYQALANQGITPGKTYDRNQFADAIEEELGVQVFLRCRGRSMLQEIFMWFHVRGASNYVPSKRLNGNRGCYKVIYYPHKYV
ncbi:hypothetical protein K7432_007786 [Basidiobolus ranarum]|uniref:ribonuclease T2 n=1 Tax=Basidiobolus ranarum TaxID=34480 RepID=A0ABR2WSV3_9FUNG